MCAVSNAATIVTDGQLRMMVLLMRYLRDHVDEGHGLVIVFKPVGEANRTLLIIMLPLRIELLDKF
jgi:hypothetical protein